MFWNDKARQS
jgi:hypothetical protein